MTPNPFLPSTVPARRIRGVLLTIGGTALFVLWDIASHWRWIDQSLATLAMVLFLYIILYRIQKLGKLPSILPELWGRILQARPRPLISRFSITLLFLSAIFFSFSIYLFPLSRALGFDITVSRLSAPGAPIYQGTVRDIHLLPFDFPYLLNDPSPARVDLTGYLFFSSSVSTKPQLYTSSGETAFLIDGKEIGRISRNPANRVTIPTIDLSAGWHRVDIHHTIFATPPSISLHWFVLSGSEYKPFQSRAVRTIEDCVHPWRIRVTRILATGFFAVALILLFSLVISWVTWHIERIPSIPQSVMTVFLILVCLGGIIAGRWALLDRTGAIIESDEAAFGLMAQRLLRGELPPIFHYGQAYQGVMEVFPLAILLKWFGSSPFALKIEPLLCYLVFSLILLFLYRKICSLAEALVLFVMLIGSPFLLMWISLKVWFGYAETLCASALILLSTYKLVYSPATVNNPRHKCLDYSHSTRRADENSPVIRRRTGFRHNHFWAVLLGLVNGLSLNILPFSVPVILAAFFFLFWRQNDRRLRTLLLAAGMTFAIAVPPYVMHDLTSQTKSGSFFLKGRQLGAPRIPGERPFMDRFLNECFPVILGGRTTYDDQRDLPPGGFPRVLYFITTVGFLLLIWDLREDFRRFLRRQSPGRVLLVLPAILAIPIGVWSPFGIWPWYFLPVYIGLPLVWASFLKFTFRYARPVALAAVLVTLVVWRAGSTTRTDLMFQPASLVKTGVILRKDDTPIIEALEKRGVSHVICDQGADFSTQSTGRDWMGERLTFESGLRIIGISPLTRRHPHLYADTVTADRVAYLFRRSYLFTDFSHVHDPGYQSITFDQLSRLFGPQYLNYTRVDLGNDVLFIPEPDHPSNGKGLWKVTANREPQLARRLHDHSISSRVYGPTYWTSGAPQTPGDFVEVDTGRIQPMRGIVMYHGVKTLDRPRGAKVFVSQDRQRWWEMGRTMWDAKAAVTSWRHTETFHARYVRIELIQPAEPPECWWTIYELWII